MVPAPCGLSGVERLTGSLKLPSGASKHGWLKMFVASARNWRIEPSKRWKSLPADILAVSMPGARREFRRESPKVPFGAMTKAVGSYHSLMLFLMLCAGCTMLGYQAPPAHMSCRSVVGNGERIAGLIDDDGRNLPATNRGIEQPILVQPPSARAERELIDNAALQGVANVEIGRRIVARWIVEVLIVNSASLPLNGDTSMSFRNFDQVYAALKAILQRGASWPAPVVSGSWRCH